jgi:hypothetical protein
MNESLNLTAAFLIGFLGSGHCLVMCGGIVGALQLLMPDGGNKLQFQIALSAGRILCYSLLGALVGGLGFLAMQLAGGSMHLLRLLSGLMLLLMALYVSKLWSVLVLLEKAGRPLWRLIQPWTKRLLPLDHPAKAFGYGLGWGLLPCGLVYSSLSWSLASGSAWHGALWMACFGLGTLPALLLAGQAASTLNGWKQKAWVRYSIAAILALYGLYTIYLALGLLVF